MPNIALFMQLSKFCARNGMRYPLDLERGWEEFTETKERGNRKAQLGNRVWSWAGHCVAALVMGGVWMASSCF
ncbi:uncharacterized protein K444DRAFT_618404 [Hyaloscypha bicolor E]|uniref:Uncharacterized protein n=1 Tax=Hyaloscypha bicolor E TaxID=1095630 RepID=A0A2J6STB3_9HELO|nr:uncharacterized protein K444DRAFT_618404 [Hyaloscypha bicolor E]PMD53943.1 hypothetical protein K444DRAFT_618404 [Hyaloscypha bicolor E]